MENIEIGVIKKIYEDYCEENKIQFSDKKFKEFLNFLEIDFYDWVRGNLRYFNV